MLNLNLLPPATYLPVESEGVRQFRKSRTLQHTPCVNTASRLQCWDSAVHVDTRARLGRLPRNCDPSPRVNGEGRAGNAFCEYGLCATGQHSKNHFDRLINVLPRPLRDLAVDFRATIIAPGSAI